MAVSQNVRRFQESITEELSITKNRVRDLIGSANWGDDGRYKEAILRKAILQFLPNNLSVGTGFIVSNDDYYFGNNSKISTQLDLIIYESGTPVIFKEGDFVILTDPSVRGVIEVKTKISNYSENGDSSLNNIIAKINRLREFESFINLKKYRKKFVGIFSFDYDDEIESKRITTALKASMGLVNHIALGPNYFVRYWESRKHLPGISVKGPFYQKYKLLNLSFSYFISNLLHIVSDVEPNDRYWFSFPIEGTKERHRLGDAIALMEQ